MDQGNLAILVDAKFEYTKQLINILKNNLFQGIKKIYNEAKEYSVEHDELDKVLKKFQFYLSEIPKWNQEVILNEVTEILDKSKCDWLEELITAVFVSHTRILTSINSNKNKKKINLNIPKIDHFIHQCYIDVARAFWKTPYLFDDTLNNYEYQRNRRDAEGIIETCIQETIRKQLPVKHILKEYLGKDYETDDEEEPKDIESEDYSNLRKMVKAEIENCSKEQLLGKAEDEVPEEITGGATTEASEAVAPDATTEASEAVAIANTTEASETVANANTTEESETVATNATEASDVVALVTTDATEASEAVVTATETETEANSDVTAEPEVKEEQITMEIQNSEQENTTGDMKIETLDLDAVDSLEDLTKLDITEVNVSNPESSVVDINSVEGLDDLDAELSQVNLGEAPTSSVNNDSITDVLNETPTLEKDVSNIKKIVIKPSELNEDDRRKKDVLKKYGRKRNFQFFNDTIESDDEF
jgi:hypothetical protein